MISIPYLLIYGYGYEYGYGYGYSPYRHRAWSCNYLISINVISKLK